MARESTIGSVFHLEKIPATPATGIDITAMTVGADTEITAANTFKAGDFVRIQDTGIKALDDQKAHRVIAVSATKFRIDTDTTGATYTSGGKVFHLEFQEVCFSEFGQEAGQPGEIDVTTMCDLERRNVSGLSSPGSATFGGPLDLTDAGQLALIAANQDGKARNLIWVTRGGQTGILYGVVSSFSAAPQGVEQAVTFSGTFQVQAPAVYLPPFTPGTITP